MMHTTSGARWLAVILGILLPGLGHVYNRQFQRAFFFHALGWGAAWLMLDFGPHVVSEGHVFVLGDYRLNSFDR